MKCDYIKELKGMAESEYQKFSAGLIPNIEKDKVLGVRLPKIRNLAKRIAKDNFREFLSSECGNTLEERLLRGFVIGYIDVELNERICLIKDFLPYINSWSVCDSFVNTLKFVNQNKTEFWEFILPLFFSDEPYYIRFAVVTVINYYTEREYMEKVFEILEKIQNGDYYVKMACAWCTAEFFAKFSEETLNFLNNNTLCKDTHNMAIRKIAESNKIAPEYKEKAKKLKR